MKKDKKGFTLIEIIIVIGLLAVMGVLSSNLGFNEKISKQNSLMFSNDVYSNIETIRNNSLLGKGVASGTNIIHPDKWLISVKSSGSGSIEAWYSTGGTLQKYKDFNVKFIDTNSKISLLSCYNITKTTTTTPTNVDLEIIGNTLTLSGCTSTNNKILDIKTAYKGFTKIIRINTVNGVIEKTDI